MILDHEMTLGALVQFTTYVAMLYEPIRWLIQIPEKPWIINSKFKRKGI